MICGSESKDEERLHKPFELGDHASRMGIYGSYRVGCGPFISAGARRCEGIRVLQVEINNPTRNSVEAAITLAEVLKEGHPVGSTH